MGVFISRTGIDISMMVMNMQCQNSCVRPQARGWLKAHNIIFKEKTLPSLIRLGENCFWKYVWCEPLERCHLKLRA